MAVNFDNYGPEYFEEVLNQIDDHPDWQYSPGNRFSIEEVAERAAEFDSEAEFYVNHVDTDGTFRLHAPNLSDPVSAVMGSLAQPLDGTQRTDPYEDSFGEKLMEAYQSIVDEVEADYLNPESDPLHILGLHVPMSYQEEKLAEALDAASEASIEVQDLNDEVMNTIESRTR
jgi:hypothetical protein